MNQTRNFQERTGVIFARYMRWFFSYCGLLLTLLSSGQSLPWPMDIPPLLSGTFGELRSGHFHAGVDIKTQGEEGQPVRSIWEGHVSRIKVSPYGYGHALYIDHPNGKTTVYAHLQRFEEDIQAYVRSLQYEKRSFALDVYVPKGKLPIDSSAIVGRSGNSGSSGGPHLHFELRDSKSQHTLNPLTHGWEKRDGKKPIIRGVRWVELDNASMSRVGGAIQEDKMHLVPDRIGIELETYDQLDGAANRNGVHSIELLVDGKESFSFTADELDFSEKRYINALTRYEDVACCKRRWVRTYVLPGNRLSNIRSVSSGQISGQLGEKKNVLIRVSDALGNKREFAFQIQVNRAAREKWEMVRIDWRKQHQMQIGEARAEVRQGTLYCDVREQYRTEDAPKGVIGPIYVFLSDSVPAHRPLTIRLPLEKIPMALRKKALIVHISAKGRISSIGGMIRDNRIQAKNRSFGRYGLAIDTIPPALRPYGWKTNGSLAGKKGIALRGSDDLSGIEKWEARINGKWHLAEYDPKRNRFFLPFEDRLPKGTHQLEFSLTDGCGNQSVIRAAFRL